MIRSNLQLLDISVARKKIIAYLKFLDFLLVENQVFKKWNTSVNT